MIIRKKDFYIGLIGMIGYYFVWWMLVVVLPDLFPYFQTCYEMTKTCVSNFERLSLLTTLPGHFFNMLVSIPISLLDIEEQIQSGFDVEYKLYNLIGKGNFMNYDGMILSGWFYGVLTMVVSAYWSQKKTKSQSCALKGKCDIL